MGIEHQGFTASGIIRGRIGELAEKMASVRIDLSPAAEAVDGMKRLAEEDKATESP